MPIIEISGASAVGKTTVIQILKDEFNAVVFNEQYQLKKQMRQTDQKSFLRNQLFLAEVILNDLEFCTQPEDYYFFDTGLFEVLSYTLLHPYFFKKEWNSYLQVISHLKTFYAEKVIAHKLIFLDAEYSTVLERKTNDSTRNRKSLSNNYTIWNEAKQIALSCNKDWISYIKNDNLTKQETFQIIQNILRCDNYQPLTVSNYIDLFDKWGKYKS